MRNQLVQTGDSLTKAHEAMESVLLSREGQKRFIYWGEIFHQTFPLTLSQSLKNTYQDIQR